MSELAALLGCLNGQRRHVLGILEGLSEVDLRRPPLPSGWSCLGLVRHSPGGPRRGATKRLYSNVYGPYRVKAVSANTTACANASQAKPKASTRMKTTVVTAAANRGPRGSSMHGS